jgi:hypothetical protein
MSRQLNFIVTIIVTLLATLLGLQLKDPDSSLMRFLSGSRTLSPYLTRQAFAQRASFSSTPIVNMASNARIEDAPPSSIRPSDTSVESQDSFKDSEGRPLGLPEPPSEEEAMKLDLSSGSDSVKLDHLGPLVVNKDGTLSRIGNWDQMTEHEKRNTLRVLGKRNQLRTSALKEAEGDAGEKAE